jgi:hypothetical protein
MSYVHVGIPRNIISYRDPRFLNAFLTALWKNMDTKLKIYTYFHMQQMGRKNSEYNIGSYFYGL